MSIFDYKYLTFDDVLIKPKYSEISSREVVSTSTFIEDNSLNLKIPIISSNMDTVTGPDMARAMYNLGGIGCLHRFVLPTTNANMVNALFKDGINCIVSIGADDKERLEEILKKCSSSYTVRLFVCVDVAHGYHKMVKDTIEWIKSLDKNIFIIAGNVATREGAKFLEDSGADMVKVGIGPGSACTTRIKTGIGVPQLSAIYECSKDISIPTIADGGIRNPGDFVKAIAAGATYVMIGGLLAGTDESPGEIKSTVVNNFERFTKSFRGMASKEAEIDYKGSSPDYKTAEGIATEVPYKGSVAYVIKDLMGGLRSAMAYVGALTLKEFRDRAEFIEVSAHSISENGAHINR